MARTGRNTKEVVREKAAEFFFEKGYDATNLREVAAASGLKIGSLYNHIESKEDLLLQVMGGAIDDLVAEQQASLQVEGDAVERLRSVVECHIRFHAGRAKEVYIGNTNLRALSEEARRAIVAKRADYSNVIEAAVVEAGRSGLASVLDPRLHTYSIVALGTHLAGWYRPGGRLSLDEIVETYTKFVLREMKVADADERVDAAARSGKVAS
ncbi:TetR/AcrR family transcriptional regulator [Corynebacterium hylobatis]|uniref:TetR/AcrR family transcriptional regulator n=1 Tax=Corynebacterium hylobatis TaxID=1859290 RepID=A0A3S0A001_9CORY|nr:TetR/AcrR family transcriptional regulator [Corynebacterium hylobatis]RSZ63842.1 TetR/AcrR family transcriptional regulator [Corynebacterium hylobatis]